MTTFESYPVASWKVGKLAALRFPVLSISESGGNRIVQRERPYRNGAKLDDTGSKAKSWTIKVCFENSIVEPGLDTTKLLYPDVLNELIASFDTHECGDLTLPTRGKVRARAESYTRDEVTEERDGAALSFTFVADNEDSVGAQQFEQRTANASARTLSEQTVFSAAQEGVWDASLSDINEFASELEGFANFPGDTVADVDSQASIVIGACNRVGRAFARENEENRNMINDPELSQTQRKLEETKDVSGRIRGEAMAGRPRPVPYNVFADTDLFDIAARIGQLAESLIAINPNVDPLYVPAGTVVQVLEF